MLQITKSALRIFPDQFERLFRVIPQSYIHWSPESWEGVPSEKLTIIEQICHVRDIEVEGYHVRFRRMLEEDNPTLESVDTYGLVTKYNYAEANPDDVFHQIHSARNKTMEIIDNLSEEQLNRKGLFEGYGQVSVKSLIHYLCSHDQQHLAGIQWLIGQIESRS